jgi:hypothetical protein
MIARLIRQLSNMLYEHPSVPPTTVLDGPFKSLKMALVTDYFTTDCLSVECQIKCLTRQNYQDIIRNWKPDLVFVESAFHGVGGNWRYELARQPRWLRWTRPKAIFQLVDFARSQGVPTVFWNKDDGAFFDAFIDVARAFDHVFTTDIASIERYRHHLRPSTSVNVLMMPYQPRFHYFDGFRFQHREICFTGSYYRRLLNERRRFLEMVMDACSRAGMKLNVFDRNHDRLSRYFEFRYPSSPCLRIHPKVPHRETERVYKNYVLSLNVNSVTDSETMCSRRLLEILACGGIAVTNPSRVVDRHFRDYCHVVSTLAEAFELFSRIKRDGPTKEDLARAAAGAEYVRQHHTWTQRLEQICTVANL